MNKKFVLIYGFLSDLDQMIDLDGKLKKNIEVIWLEN